MNTFSSAEMFRFGWDTFKKRPWFLIGTMVLFWIVVGGISALLLKFTVGSRPLLVIGSVVRILFELFAIMGLIAFSLKAHDAVQSVSLGDFWHPQDFWNFLGAIVAQVLVVLAGIVTLVIPGIMLSVSLKFSPYFVIDKHEGPIESLFSSARITQGKKWALFQFFALVLVINLAGLFVLVVGLLVTLPVTMLATIHAYRALSRE